MIEEFAAAGRLLAVDWGTSRRRVAIVEPHCHRIVDDAPSGIGRLRTHDFAEAITALQGEHGGLPVLLSGMIGSDLGLRNVPHLPCPVTVEDVAHRLAEAGPGWWIVPGLRCEGAGRVDVLRGEEVQTFGALACFGVPKAALICQPGTHTKWISTEKDEIRGFATALAGELYGLLREYSTLKSVLGKVEVPDESFLAGVRRGASASAGDLLADFFTVRAEALLAGLARNEAAARLSGLLVGADVARNAARRSTVVLLAEPGSLANLYKAAFVHLGIEVILIDALAAFVAGARLLSGLAA